MFPPLYLIKTFNFTKTKKYSTQEEYPIALYVVNEWKSCNKTKKSKHIRFKKKTTYLYDITQVNKCCLLVLQTQLVPWYKM